MKLTRLVVVAALVLAMGACSKPEEEKVPVPKGFDVPAGVTLTDGGTTLAKGKPAWVIYQVAGKTRSVVKVAVTAVDKGDIKDFTFFSLDDDAKESTPYYVKATIENIGPAGLGAAPIPLYAHDSDNTITLPNELVGEFKPCPNGTLPESFLPDSKAEVCLVYLVPKGSSLVSIDLQTVDQTDPIIWKP